jgi:lambda family phage portal protein
MSTYFKSAERNAYNIDWVVRSEATPDDELDEGDSLVTLRERSRQLVKDNPIVAGLQQLFINMVGTPNAIRVKSGSNVRTKQAQEYIDSFVADSTFDNLSLDEVIEQIVSCSFTEGDLLISLPIDNNRSAGRKTVVELIEGYRIKTPSDLQKDGDVRNGVKYDKEGRILGYYVKKYDSVGSYGEQSSNYIYYPRIKGERVVTRLFKAPLNSRPKMSRQYPVITPIIPLIKHMDDYLEAVIVGARVAACFSAFVTTTNPAKAMESMTTDGGGTAITDPKDGYGSRRVTKLKPGTISYLKKNEEISFASPNKPGDNVDEFLVRLQRFISVYIRVPYEIAFLDLSETNYSSWRGGDNEVKKLKMRWRKRLDAYINWIVSTILEEATLFEVIRSGDSRLKIRWAAFNVIDSLKENKANQVDLVNKTTTPQRIVEERGESFEEIQQELLEFELLQLEQEAIKLKRKAELEVKYGVVFPVTETEGATNDDNDNDDDGDDGIKKRKR